MQNPSLLSGTLVVALAVVFLLPAGAYGGATASAARDSAAGGGRVLLDLLQGSTYVSPELTLNGYENNRTTAFPTLLTGNQTGQFWNTGQPVMVLAPSLAGGHDAGTALFRGLSAAATSLNLTGTFEPAISGDGLEGYLFMQPTHIGNFSGPFYATDPEGPNGSFVSPQGSVIFPYSTTPYVVVQWDPAYGVTGDFHIYVANPGPAGTVNSSDIQTLSNGTAVGPAPSAGDLLAFNVTYRLNTQTLVASVFDETTGTPVAFERGNLSALSCLDFLQPGDPFWFGAGGSGNYPAGWGLLALSFGGGAVSHSELQSVTISPTGVAVGTGGNFTFQAALHCSAGGCPSGAIEEWSLNNSLAALVSSEGPSIDVLAGPQAGSVTILVFATLQGVTRWAVAEMEIGFLNGTGPGNVSTPPVSPSAGPSSASGAAFLSGPMDWALIAVASIVVVGGIVGLGWGDRRKGHPR